MTSNVRQMLLMTSYTTFIISSSSFFSKNNEVYTVTNTYHLCNQSRLSMQILYIHKIIMDKSYTILSVFQDYSNTGLRVHTYILASHCVMVSTQSQPLI